MVSYGLD